MQGAFVRTYGNEIPQGRFPRTIQQSNLTMAHCILIQRVSGRQSPNITMQEPQDKLCDSHFKRNDACPSIFSRYYKTGSSVSRSSTSSSFLFNILHTWTLDYMTLDRSCITPSNPIATSIPTHHYAAFFEYNNLHIKAHMLVTLGDLSEVSHEGTFDSVSGDKRSPSKQNFRGLFDGHFSYFSFIRQTLKWLMVAAHTVDTRIPDRDLASPNPLWLRCLLINYLTSKGTNGPIHRLTNCLIVAFGVTRRRNSVW